MGTAERLRGSASVSVRHPRPEEVLNGCVADGIPVYRATLTKEDTLILQIPERCLPRLAAACPPGAEVRPLRRRGLPVLWRRLRARPGLYLGCALCLAVLWASSLFIWRIDIRGNRRVSDAELLDALADYGVSIGAFRWNVDQQGLSNGILLRLTELSWITVNTWGSRLQVIVREETPAPELAAPEIPREITACRDGVVVRMTVLQGLPQVRTGDAVRAGELLISSEMPSLHSDVRRVRASGEVWAVTGYELEAVCPLVAEHRVPTGAQRSRFALLLGKTRWNFYYFCGNPYADCDRITTEYALTLPGGGMLPLRVFRETLTEYETATVFRDADQAERALRALLLERLRALLPERAQTRSVEYAAEQWEGAVRVTLSAECLEDIAQTSPRDTDGAGET